MDFLLKEFQLEEHLGPLFNIVLNDDLLVVSTVVLLVFSSLLAAPVEQLPNLKACEGALGHFGERKFDGLPVPLSDKVKSVLVSYINFFKFIHDLNVHHLEVIFNRLVEYLMRELLAHNIGVVTQPLDACSVDQF